MRNSSQLWHTTVLRTLLKNHKWQRRPEEEWIVIENAREAIVSQKLWDKVKEVEKAVGHGKYTVRGYMHPLSGLMYCADCGAAGIRRT